MGGFSQARRTSSTPTYGGTGGFASSYGGSNSGAALPSYGSAQARTGPTPSYEGGGGLAGSFGGAPSPYGNPSHARQGGATPNYYGTGGVASSYSGGQGATPQGPYQSPSFGEQSQMRQGGPPPPTYYPGGGGLAGSYNPLSGGPGWMQQTGYSGPVNSAASLGLGPSLWTNRRRF